ncbi:hypothetical protein [Actinoplanes couchii]|uniref:hypothetical protein n=1 Tax=Actinoplanes couchii TaxID=403638 RepID=UPI001942C810|nr:hypothetical protein [Actinoplanes couchii]MDR6325921.1 hypothetical protein [Actinoplanes couchii]
MGELAGLLERIDVSATSPDGAIRATVSGRLRLTLDIRSRDYTSCSETDLAHRIERLATTLWIRYHREYAEVEEAFLGPPGADPTPEDRRFGQEAADLTVTATSPGGWVTVTSRALATWTVRLEPGIQRELSVDRFAAEAIAAATGAIGAYRAGRMRLLDRYYDLSNGLPPWRRADSPREPW